jgi:hypothetical protein
MCKVDQEADIVPEGMATALFEQHPFMLPAPFFQW